MIEKSNNDAELAHKGMLEAGIACMGRYILDVAESQNEQIGIQAINDGGLRLNKGQPIRILPISHIDVAGLAMWCLTESELIASGVKIDDFTIRDIHEDKI